MGTTVPAHDSNSAAASTSLAGAAVQPGRPAFEAEEKAPVSSSIPEPPRDNGDFEQLIEDEEELIEREEEREEIEPTRIAREGEQFEKERDQTPGLGVAVPAAAEGTSALPVQAIVQAEEAGGGKIQPPAEQGKEEKKVVREEVSHEQTEEGEEGEAEIDLGERMDDFETEEGEEGI